MAEITPPLKWHGGKHYLAKRIISLMPPRAKNPNSPDPDDTGWLHYVEPFAGGLAVLLALDPEGISEVVNDMDFWLTNFWGVLAQPKLFKLFSDRCQATMFSEPEWEACKRFLGEHKPEALQADLAQVMGAWAFFVACRQSLAGRMTTFAPLTRNRTRRGMNEQVSAWLNAVDGLPAVHQRLRRVAILNQDALDVIRKQDGPRTLFYLDPPYLHETRSTTTEYGDHEMSRTNHEILLDQLMVMEGRFLLSGYRSDLYDDYAARFGWNRHDITIPNHAAAGPKKRTMTECVWANF